MAITRQKYAHHNSWKSFDMVIDATTTAPTKGTIQEDKAVYKIDGDDLVIHYNYSQTVAGTAGSGTYLFKLPVGFEINEVATTSSTGPFSRGVVGTCASAAGGGPTRRTGYVRVFETDTLVLSFADNTTDSTDNVGSVFNSLASNDCQFSFMARVPIKAI